MQDKMSFQQELFFFYNKKIDKINQFFFIKWTNVTRIDQKTEMNRKLLNTLSLQYVCSLHSIQSELDVCFIDLRCISLNRQQ